MVGSAFGAARTVAQGDPVSGVSWVSHVWEADPQNALSCLCRGICSGSPGVTKHAACFQRALKAAWPEPSFS